MHGARGQRARDAVAEHASIYKAIRAGDPDAAARARARTWIKTLEDYRRDIQHRLFRSDSTDDR
jgi:GntR family transcriptional regulator, transcriptional repressor for pyruvate dehydrogenase complex